MDNIPRGNLGIYARIGFPKRSLHRLGDVVGAEPSEVIYMAFIVTGIYILALFSAGVVFVRRGKKEQQDKEEHCPATTPAWDGQNRRNAEDRRSGSERRRRDAVLTP